jgi:hypothetical protein
MTFPGGLIFAGYRNSHVIFDGLAEIDCYAAFFPILGRSLQYGETGEAIVNLVGPDTGGPDPAQVIREGTRFVLLRPGAFFAEGSVVAVLESPESF